MFCKNMASKYISQMQLAPQLDLKTLKVHDAIRKIEEEIYVLLQLEYSYPADFFISFFVSAQIHAHLLESISI